MQGFLFQRVKGIKIFIFMQKSLGNQGVIWYNDIVKNYCILGIIIA